MPFWFRLLNDYQLVKLFIFSLLKWSSLLSTWIITLFSHCNQPANSLLCNKVTVVSSNPTLLRLTHSLNYKHTNLYITATLTRISSVECLNYHTWNITGYLKSYRKKNKKRAQRNLLVYTSLWQRHWNLDIDYVNYLMQVSSDLLLFSNDVKLRREVSKQGDKLTLQEDLTRLQSCVDKNSLNFNNSRCKAVRMRYVADYAYILSISRWKRARSLGIIWF